MGEPGFGYRPPRIRLFDAQLKLDPSIEQMMLELQAKMAGPQMTQQWLQPNFQLLLPHWEAILGPGPNPVFLPVPPPAYTPTAGPGFQPIGPPAPAYTRGDGPATAKPGELSDVLKAIYKLPAVQELAKQAKDQGERQLKELHSEWQSAGTADRVLMISVTGVVVGGMVTTILANEPTRNLAFGFIKNKDIPIPGVKGLSFKIMDGGAGATVPLGVPGLSAKGYYTAPDGKAPDYGATVTFDVIEFLKKK
ncbi:hypothetical protein D3874_00780 [Oleomonas cavernae]|uniref:Uncharacterized protein n=1 Tax=Oleomonas cavernae TaxID=2320859 RepID=A0A418WTB7_9PROT|nr:hypothetical protein [Oleomonas cavernae]RJF94416.1 hypothetical protein D3874_00780 [Oleomonas cavernae]